MQVVLVQLVSLPHFSAFYSISYFLCWNVFFVHPFWYVLQEKPYSRELCVKCSSCFRGIHKDCLTPDDLHVLYEEGVLCSVCTANKKKRTLTFPSNSQRYPPPPPPPTKTHLEIGTLKWSLIHLFVPSFAVRRVQRLLDSMKPSAQGNSPLRKLRTPSAQEKLKRFFLSKKTLKQQPNLHTLPLKQIQILSLK